MGIINSVNNKPLKCIITNNDKTIQYLKNSGDLIVLDETEKRPGQGDDYREIYLADYFLAGGRGVYTKEQQDTLIEIVNTFKDTIQDLKDIDSALNIYIDEKFNILSNEKVSITYDKGNDVIDETANASNTFILFESNNKRYAIKTSDIFKIIAGLPEYKNAEVLDISYNIEYVDYENNIHTETNAKNLPINTYVNNIQLKIRLDLHDCGDITKIFYEYVSSNSESSSELITHVVTINSNINSVVRKLENNNVEINISISYGAGAYIIKEGNNEFFLQFMIDIAETPISKYLTINGVKTIDNKDIVYTANMIKAQTKSLDIPSVQGEYYLCYYNFDRAISVPMNTSPLNVSSETPNYTKIIFYEYNKTQVQYTYINGVKSKQMVIVVLPINFIIKSAHLVNSDSEYNITNFVNYFAYSANANKSVLNKLRSSVYIIYVSKKISREDTLKLEILHNENNYIDVYDSTTTVNRLYARKLGNIVNFSNFKDYWIDDNKYSGSEENIKNDHLQFVTNYGDI